MEEHLSDIAQAFSDTAEKYDRFAEDHPNLTRMRQRVYRHLLDYLQPGARVLELNAGTGADAVFLANQGFHVLATDIAPGMLQRAREKVENAGLNDRVKIQDCSFASLEKIQNAPFDAVFSNLGGLNCISDLSIVTEQLPRLLLPGGMVTWVIMPPICLWELALAFTGNFRFAFRRFASQGTLAHLEGKYFPIYYFTPHQVASAFGPDFRLLALEGLAVITPPAESKNLARRHPFFYRQLCWMDDRLSLIPPFRGWGDFFIISFRYQPEGIS